MAERILLLSEPQSARLSSMRASALAVCSYIEESDWIGRNCHGEHEAVVNDGAAAGWREARKSIDHDWLRLDDASTRILRSEMFGDNGKIGSARTGIDRFLQHLADQFSTADSDSGIRGQFQRIGQILQRVFGRERALGEIAGHDRLEAVIAQRETVGRTFRQGI